MSAISIPEPKRISLILEALRGESPELPEMSKAPLLVMVATQSASREVIKEEGSNLRVAPVALTPIPEQFIPVILEAEEFIVA